MSKVQARGTNLKVLLEKQVGRRFDSGYVEVGDIGTGRGVVADRERGPARIADSPRQDGLERREEVEKRDGDQHAIVGHDEPRRKSLAVSHTCKLQVEKKRSFFQFELVIAAFPVTLVKKTKCNRITLISY